MTKNLEEYGPGEVTINGSVETGDPDRLLELYENGRISAGGDEGDLLDLVLDYMCDFYGHRDTPASVYVCGEHIYETQTWVTVEYIIEKVIVEGELTKEEILEFFLTFTQEYDSKVVWFKPETGQVKLQARLDL